jgi:riboflavin synthase alpha subunit
VFSGIVEAIGCVVEVARRRGGSRIVVQTPFAAKDVALGASVAVDGVCLTVTRRERGRLCFDVVAETLSRTTLIDAVPGRPVNLERSLVAGQPIGGHLLLGHVDAVAPVLALSRRGLDRRLRVALGPGLRRLVAPKGSIALDGVSLTVSAVDARGCTVALVPHTLERTTLGRLDVGARLNVEVDLVARYLDRIVAARRPGRRRSR